MLSLASEQKDRYESKRLIVRVADYDDIDEETLQKIEKEPHRYHIIIEEPDEEDLFEEMETAFAWVTLLIDALLADPPNET